MRAISHKSDTLSPVEVTIVVSSPDKSGRALWLLKNKL